MSTRTRTTRRFAAGASAALLTGLLALPASAAPEEVTFEVTITNTSTLGLLDTDRAGGQVPLSPVVLAVHNGGQVLFTPGQPASDAIEDIAEDGDATVALADLASTNRVSDSGALFGPNGPVLAGDTVTWTVTATRGDRLSLATMFVQSNDAFFGDDGTGIALFERGEPISGDVTHEIELWDAGTEVDTAPGTGPFQVLAQPGADTGPDEGGVIGLASRTGFDYPAVEDVITVMVTPIG